jgi:TonB family protein
MRFQLTSAACIALLWAPPLAAQDVYLPSDQVTAPQVIESGKPTYTSEIMRALIRGTSGVVVLQVDVRPDGTVGTVALVKGLGSGLDEHAAKEVKQWLFAPGEKDGKPVTVRIEVTIPFNSR